MRDKKKDGKKVKEEAGVEGRGESEGQKDRSCDKSGGRRRGGDGFNTSVVCFSGNGTFKTLHPHELDRPLENTRVTF